MTGQKITLVLDGAEQRALRELIDAALRHNGIAAVAVASHFLAKLEAATASPGTGSDPDPRGAG